MVTTLGIPFLAPTILLLGVMINLNNVAGVRILHDETKFGLEIITV